MTDNAGEVRNDILSRSVLWRICAAPCEKQCKRARRCTSNRDRCVERLIPTPETGNLCFHLRTALLIAETCDWTAEEAAWQAADDMETDDMTVPDGQARRVAKILACLQEAKRER